MKSEVWQCNLPRVAGFAKCHSRDLNLALCDSTVPCSLCHDPPQPLEISYDVRRAAHLSRKATIEIQEKKRENTATVVVDSGITRFGCCVGVSAAVRIQEQVLKMF